MKIHAYIDGFNLYHRALKGTPYKWLDLATFCQKLAPPKSKIEQINYFTARVHRQPGNSGAHERQSLYFKALRQYIPNLDIVYGQYRTHAKVMRLLTPGGDLERREVSQRGRRLSRINRCLFKVNRKWKVDPGPPVHVIKTEEKGSDVNLAVRLVHDGCLDKYEGAMVISNDTDLTEALRIVIEEINKPVWLVSPARRTAARLQQQLRTTPSLIYKGTLKNSQLPSPIPGTQLSKPPSW